MALRASVRARHRGASLVETMVGILIGMIVIAVVYNILSVAEGYKRATVGSSDAQITGLLTQFMASPRHQQRRRGDHDVDVANEHCRRE